MKIFKNIWIHQVASWITIIFFVSFILNKILNIMLSQPILFLICIAAGLIMSSLLFSAHAYYKVAKGLSKIAKIDDYLTEIKNNTTILARLDKLEKEEDAVAQDSDSHSDASYYNFPLLNWLTGSDLIKTFEISEDQLKQHIENGLPGYIKNPENQELRLITERDLIACDEFQGEAENMINQWLFKAEDVEKYMKSTQQTTLPNTRS